MRIRGAVATIVATGLISLAAAAPASAGTTTSLALSQSAAFSILGHSCGGIQEHPYATGFGANGGTSGYPVGEVYMQTKCGGSGRGGGYTVTTYSAWATVTWDWYGDTRSYAKLEGTPEVSTSFSAEDAYGDRVYNTETAAYLQTTSPPLVAPAAPTGVTASQYNIEVSEKPVLRFEVAWTPAAETAALITSSTVTATPIGSSAPVLASTVSGGSSSAIVGPLEPNTTYRITVTSTDAEGTSEPSTPIEATSPSEDGEVVGKEPPEEGPEFGRCVKVAGTGRFTTANCETESATETGGYEWVRGVSKRGFSTTIKPTTTVKLETSTSREKVTCTGEHSTGEITGLKTAGNVLITLSGCESLGGSCTTAGLGEGELQTSTLQGTLGIVSTTEKEGKEIVHIGLSLQAVGGAPFLEYACTTSGTAVIGGTVIAPVASGKMAKTAAFKLAESGGKQKPEAFEGGLREVLTNQLGEQVGVALSATQQNEEAVEINPLF